MNTTRLIPSTSQRPAASRVRRLALTVAAGATLTLVAPGLDVDVASAAPSRRCDSASAATYTVVSGDSWFSVATASRISMAALLRANDADASAAVHPGDVLCLPSGVTNPPGTSQGGCASNHSIVAGDSWFGISQAAGVSLNGLLEANDATATTVLQPGVAVCIPERTAATGTGSAGSVDTAKPQTTTTASCVTKRSVVAGESWYVISRSTGVPIDALLTANGAKRSSTLYPGQILCLPGVGFGRELPSVPLDVGPVRGACRFANSWQASRDSGRLHEGVDLISPSGTPVVAVADGTLTRQAKSGSRSGNAWWLTTSSGTYFFYAHLSRFGAGLSVGSRVHAGDVIGYVGSTGNAVSPHLHFEIHPWGGAPVNPYSAIWMAGGCNYDRRYEQTPLS